jgi:hypothetical protein
LFVCGEITQKKSPLRRKTTFNLSRKVDLMIEEERRGRGEGERERVGGNRKTIAS